MIRKSWISTRRPACAPPPKIWIIGIGRVTGPPSATARHRGSPLAAAAAKGEPLWRAVAEGGPVTLPMPMIQIFGGGAHAGRRVDIQDFLIMPVGAASFDEALAMAARVYRAAGQIMADRGLLRGVADEGGWWPEFVSNAEALDTLVEAIERAALAPGEEVGIAIDVAASQFHSGGRYRLAADRVELETEALIELLAGWNCEAA